MPSVLSQIGMAAIGASRKPDIAEAKREALLDEAIDIFRAMLVRRTPSLVRVRLELGRAFFLKGEDKLARRHFEHVLAGKLPAAVALNVTRFLKSQMRARKRWSLRLGMPRSCPTAICRQPAPPSERSSSIPRSGDFHLPFRTDYEAPKSGIGISAWVGGEYQYPLAESWRLRAGGDLSRKRVPLESEFDTNDPLGPCRARVG